ncbi:MAG TPA: hypothetical protein VFO66_01520 [Gemmatimonadaceae bacterium]|nr:hypothetical protein [Gemmatimonadaceae bacterium]
MAAPVRAQTPDSALHAALSAIPARSLVRIKTIGRNTFDGRLAGLSSTRLYVIEPGGVEAFADLDRIAEVHLRGDQAGTGALTGAIVGGTVLGLLSGVFFSSMCECSDGSNAFVEGLTFGTSIGALSGGFTGFVLGSFAGSWRLYWSRERGVVSRALVMRADSTPARWGGSLHGGAATRWSFAERSFPVVAARLERARPGRKHVGIETGFFQPPTLHTAFERFGPGGATVVDSFRTSSSSFYASLVVRSAVDERGETYWLADVGAARVLSRSRMTVGTFPEEDRERDAWPLFGAGLGTTWGRWSAELRARGPVSFARVAGTMVSLTGAYRP